MQGKRKMSGGKSAHSVYPAPGIYHLQDASLFGRTFCQRLLFSDGVILIRKNTRTEITFQRWSNPDSEEYSYRDYFMVMESIFIRQNLQLGIIFVGEKHLNSKECSCRDAFVVEK